MTQFFLFSPFLFFTFSCTLIYRYPVLFYAVSSVVIVNSTSWTAPKNSAASASRHALYPSEWYALNKRGVKNWFAVMCCGKAPHIASDSPCNELPWQRSQQQKVKLSTSSASCCGPIPHLPSSRSTSMSRNASFHVTRSCFFTPFFGCLGEIRRTSPSPTLIASSKMDFFS